MFKVTSGELIRILKTLEKQNFAINTLERLGNNQMVFLETKQEANVLIDELKSRYGIEQFDEWMKAEKKNINQT